MIAAKRKPAKRKPSTARLWKLAEVLEARWWDAWPKVLRGLRVPHRLPARAPTSGPQFPHRPALEAAFAPLGFRGGGRALKMWKKTARGNRIYIWCDVGTWSHAATFKLDCERDDVVVRFMVCFCANQDLKNNGSYTSYPVADEPTWRKMMANAAVVVAHIEAHELAEFERA